VQFAQRSVHGEVIHDVAIDRAKAYVVKLELSVMPVFSDAGRQSV